MSEIFKTISSVNPLPSISINSLPIYVFGALVVYILFYTLRMIFLLYFKKNHTFIGPNLKTQDVKKKRILILGDSLALGIGADKFEDTINGKLTKDFPDAEIINLARENSLVKDLTDQIKDIIDQKFDLIIISAGTNDIWHFTRQITLLKHLDFVLEASKVMSNNRVLFLINNNIEDAPLLKGMVRHFLKSRFQTVQRTLNLICYQKEVPTIDFYTAPAHPTFLDKNRELFSIDGLHPSSDAYDLWYKRMWLLMIDHGFRTL